MSQPHRPSTAQDIFNTVALHLLTQGRPARSSDGSCYYRHPVNSTQCAVGVLIPDADYSKDMENILVGSLAQEGRLPKHLMPHVRLLDHLQSVHDSPNVLALDGETFDRNALISELKEVAADYHLNDQVLMVA